MKHKNKCFTHASVTISVKRTLLESVTQKKFDTVVATIKGDTAALVNKDVVIKNSVGRVILTKSVAVDAKDKTQVTIVAFENMNDGKEYTMTVDETTVPFTVTDGKVASVGIDKTVVACDKDVEIKVQAKDANGVLVYEAGFAEVDAAHYTATITSTISTFQKTGSKIRLAKAGDTATAKVTWVSGTYDEKGQPKEKIESGDITITAGEPAAVDNFSMKIKTTTTPGTENFAKIDANSQVKITDTTNAYAFFQFKDVDGTEVVRYADYTLESTNNAVITLVGNITSKYVQVVPGSVGTAYILVKKNNVVVTSFEITVVAGSDINSFALDKTDITMSNTVAAAEKQTVKATIKDQYGKDFTPAGNMTVSLVNVSSADPTVASATIISDVNNAANVNKYFTAGSKQVEFYASTNGAVNTAGTYVYKLSYKDSKNVEWAQTVTVTLKAPATAGTVNDTVAIEIDKSSVDLAVNKDNKNDITVTVGVALYRNGVKDHTLSPGGITAEKIQTVNGTSDVTAAAINYVVKKDGATVLTYSTSDGAITKTANAAMANIDVTTAGGTITFKVRKDDSSVIKKIATGTYTVEATILTEDGATPVAKTPVVPNAASFVITDSQATGTVTLKNATVKSTVATNLQTLVANALQYSGYDYNIGPDAAAGQTAFVSTGTALTFADKEVKINYIEGTSNISGSTAITKDNYNGGEAVTVGTTVTVNKINLSVVVPGSSKAVTFTIDLTKDANGVAQPGINFSVVQG